MIFRRYIAMTMLPVALVTPGRILSSVALRQQAPADQSSRKAQPPPVWTNETEAFALGDDEIGESFKTFSSHHPKAQCIDSTSTTKSCYQWENISIYGMSAHPSPDCSLKSRGSANCIQGLSAQFKNQLNQRVREHHNLNDVPASRIYSHGLGVLLPPGDNR